MSTPARAAEQRKLISVVFADVVGSTAFGSDNDPEAVRSVMASYFERMRAIAELHGGTVEKFIGDAVMVVFGIPKLHDDDAERAVRAALAMRDAMADLDRELAVALAARVGVNSGEAVAGSGGEGQFLVTGDAVNVAARLQQAAEPGEVVVGPLTESLTRAAIEYEPRAAVQAKGKTEPLQAFRAVRAKSAIPEQARGLPAMRAQLVGRQRELHLLLDTFERVRTERRAHLFTLVGNAGIGKSRLVGEVLARVGAGGDARVLRGRCLPYGQGITYWPLMEIVRDDAQIGSADDRDTAIAKVGARCAELHRGDAAQIARRLVAMLGLQRVEEALPEARPADVAEEIAWAVREHIVAIARDPVVVVVDDLQWASSAVIEIVEGVAERAEDAPLLLLCVARPTLLETHPSWAAGRANAATITLDALSADETTTLIARLLDVDDLPADLRARVVQRSEGNPLFCEEFLRMLIDEGRVIRDGDRWRAAPSAADVRVPESIHALLAARLDGLADDARAFLQAASVVGERFGTAEVAALAPGIDVRHAIAALRRAGLVLEDRETREPDRYRFKHLLMRDVAYAALPKATRADLHETFARELERAVGDRRGEYAEILAHHVERAFALSVEVRAPQAVVEPRARAVLERALALGERAARRADLALLHPYARAAAAAIDALGDRAAPAERIGAALLTAAADRFSAAYPESLAGYEEAARLAESIGRRDLAALAHLGAAQTFVWMVATPEEFERLEAHIEAATRLFAELGEPGREVEARMMRLELFWAAGDMDGLVREGLLLQARAREANEPVSELLVCSRVLSAALLGRQLDVAARLDTRARELVALLGGRTPFWLDVSRTNTDRERGDLTRTLEDFRRLEVERGVQNTQELLPVLRNQAEILAIDLHRYDDARPLIERAHALSVSAGDRWHRAELTGLLAIVMAAAGDASGADRMIAQAHESIGVRDEFARLFVTHCAARVAELSGRLDEAEATYRAAGDRFRASGWARAGFTAAVFLDHAELLARMGRGAEAAQRLATAEEMLGEQTGERAERIARLRARVPSAR
ncbi:MAG TPA: adenylate/guanylate cyclase domain-containing protein [Candidatus Limnocylindria bacterium]|nr:adenylate/guanylate cyclase domain-containing protein [Candidatus Limnocylindria bacterium]